MHLVKYTMCDGLKNMCWRERLIAVEEKFRSVKINVATNKRGQWFMFPPRRYPYFDVVVGLVWSHDPKSYAGGSVCYW
jgi:hypothetical protein